MKKNEFIRIICTCLSIVFFTVIAMASGCDKDRGTYLDSDDKRREEIKELMEDRGMSYEEAAQYQFMNELMSDEHLSRDEALKVMKLMDEENMKRWEAVRTVRRERESSSSETSESDAIGTTENDINSTDLAEETTVAVPVLSIDEIVGTYQTVSTIEARIKGKDEDEEWRAVNETEVTFTYIVTAVDDNTISLEFGGAKFGEGFYDPVTCSCEFTVDPGFYESMHATPKDDNKTVRIVFSKVDGKIQFQQTVVDGDGESEPAVAVKVS